MITFQNALDTIRYFWLKIILVKNIIGRFYNWPVYFLAFSGLLRSPTVEIRIRGTNKATRIIIPIDSLSRVPLQEVWVSHSYSFPGFDVNGGDSVVDIGANIGNFTVYAADKATRGKVFAYEPCRENFKFLNRNIQINQLRNVQTYSLGVSDSTGKKEIFISGNSVSPSLFKGFKGGGYSYFIEVIGLKEVFENNSLERINFLKIDAEGSEYDIMFGVDRKYLDRIDRIAVEYHQGDFTAHGVNDLANLLTEKKFNLSVKAQGSGQTGMIYAWRKGI